MEQNQDKQLLEQVTEKAKLWLRPGYDEETRAEVQRMLDADDKTELIESFYRDLEFGTGGLRGIMGAGTNRMNIYTVGAATQGLANYLKEAFKDLPEISVAVGHDVRNNSRKFAEIVANIFSANGIKVYLFDSFRPTPELSYAIRYFGCQSGVNITASHNPKEYNGYKAYWADGAQIIAPHDVNIIDNVNRITDVDQIKFQGNPDKIQIIGKEVDDAFLKEIKGLIPDGNFSTVESPNPEVPSAMAMAIERARETDADVVFASDPDADRIGCVVRDRSGNYRLLNGNQIVMILLNYIMRRNREMGKLKGNEYVVKTIVTTETIKTIAENYNVKMYDCYTGFKWIASVIRDLEGTERYLGGGEESYGFLAEDFVRDKDSVSAISLMAEIAAWAKDNGMNFLEMLQDIYVQNGYSHEVGVSVVRTGKEGAEEIQKMMKEFRANPPKQLGGSPVTLVKDYADLNCTEIATGKVTKMDFPTTSNVLQYFTEDGSKVSVRPSGTEPKIKFYMEVKGHMAAKEDFDAAEKAAAEKIELLKKDLGI